MIGEQKVSTSDTEGRWTIQVTLPTEALPTSHSKGKNTPAELPYWYYPFTECSDKNTIKLCMGMSNWLNL